MNAQHYKDCSCGTCHYAQASRPIAAAVQARHLSGASIGKLIEWEVGKDVATGAHVWSPAGTLVNVWHGQDSTEVSVNYDHPGDYADTLDQIGLGPDQWVRVTQTPAKDAA